MCSSSVHSTFFRPFDYFVIAVFSLSFDEPRGKLHEVLSFRISVNLQSNVELNFLKLQFSFLGFLLKVQSENKNHSRNHVNVNPLSSFTECQNVKTQTKGPE